MEDELRLSLLVLGTCFIIAVLVHGLWVSRKNKQKSTPRIEPDAWEDESEDELNNEQGVESTIDDGLDELGLGKPRVVQNDSSAEFFEDTETEILVENTATDTPSLPETDDVVSDEDNEQAEAIEEKLYGSVVTQPKPHLQSAKSDPSFTATDIPEPPNFLLDESQTATSEANQPPELKEKPKAECENQEPDFQLNAQTQTSTEKSASVTSLGEHAKKLVTRKKAKPTVKKRQEPKLGEDQMRIDFDEPSEKQSPHMADKENNRAATNVEQEVLVLNVRAPDENPIAGAALLPMLLTLGFKFGDQDIFHRHVNSNGKGPVLFSLANMFKPGVFDIDNVENFTTQGVSLFMILPIDDPHQVFNMMHNAARKIADEFGAQVLDGRRSVLTKQGLQQYVEKIRDFERRRMISR